MTHPAPWQRVAHELARAGIPCRVPRVIRASQATTFVVSVAPSDVPAMLAPPLAVRLAAALGVSHVRVSRDGAAVLVQASLPDSERRPVPLASLPRGAGMAVPVGRDVMGRVVSLDLSDDTTPHALVCGTTGSGKSETLRTIVAGMARQCDPSALRLMLIDGKAETWPAFASLAHLSHQVITEPRDGTAALAWAVGELVRRADGWTSRLVIVIDELRYIIHGPGAEHLERLTAQGRSRGIHVVCATQYASSDVLGRIVKANLPCRIVGTVDDAQASVMATGRKGLDAHSLSGRGDVLVVAGRDVRRVQVALCGEGDIKGVAMGANYPTFSESSAEPDSTVEYSPHWSQAPTPVADDEAAWAASNGRDGAPAGIVAIRRRFGCGEVRARRIQEAASQASHPSQAPALRVVGGRRWAGDPGGMMPARVALAMGE